MPIAGVPHAGVAVLLRLHGGASEAGVRVQFVALLANQGKAWGFLTVFPQCAL